LLTFDAEHVVFKIRADSPAAHAGILPNDRILAVDGDPIDAPGAYTKTRWTFEPPAPVTLTLKRKTEVFERTLIPELLFPDDLDRLRTAGPDLEPPAVQVIKKPDGTWELIFPEGFNSGDDTAPAAPPEPLPE
jgi:membrane-associated protease RseP (regulator of RpoE activity)